MTGTLYSLRNDGDQWRITKFVDGDVESTYLCTDSECECPAGHRHTCRHRQMLPTMLAHHIANTHYFMDYDGGGRIVDFNGTPKRLFDELAAIPGVQVLTLDDPETLHNTIAEAVSEALTLNGLTIPLTTEPVRALTPLPKPAWRRL